MMLLSLPILAQMGLVSVAVKYAVDKYVDDSVPKAEDEVVEETTNTQNPQTPAEGQSLLGKTCIENRKRILSLMEEQKKLVPGDDHKLLKDKHKLLKEECQTNKDNISSLTTDLNRNNNTMIDSISSINKKADDIYRTCAHNTRSAEERSKNHHTIMNTHIKNTMDRAEFTYGDDSLFKKDIKKELTVMEEALQTIEGRNAS